MELNTTGICTVEEWYCTVVMKNVQVAVAPLDGSRRCLRAEECVKKRGDCTNSYINNRR